MKLSMSTVHIMNITTLQFRRFIVVILLISIASGIFFRCFNVDKKVYWYDEAFTSLRLSGYTYREFIENSFTSEILTLNDILKYQNINSDKDWQDTFNSLKGDVHPPLYFIGLREWANLFGSSVSAVRGFSVFVGLLSIPCLYWLCIELFCSTSTALISSALFALSPFHVLFAQEARMYSLLTLLTLFSTVLLVRSLRLNTYLSWFLYAIALSLGFNTHLYFVLVAFSHTAYVLIVERFKLSKRTACYSISCMTALLTFSPWVLIMIRYRDSVGEITAGGQSSQSALVLGKAWIRNLSQTFIDLGRSEYTAPFIVIFIIISVCFLAWRASKNQALLILTLIGGTAVVLIASDLILGGSSSERSRYFIPCYLGCEISVAYLIKTELHSAINFRKMLAAALMIVLLIGGFASCLISSQAEVWWSKGHSQYNFALAKTVNSAEAPLLISDTNSLNVVDILALSHVLESKVKFQLVTRANLPNLITENISDIFIYNPSQALKTSLNTQFRLSRVDKNNRLFKID